jgi:hypothetical protein
MGDMVPRRTREQRAYRLAVAGGSLAAIAVVTFVLAVIGVTSAGIPFGAAVLALVCFYLFRRAVRM